LCLWLGDNTSILSMVKPTHPFFLTGYGPTPPSVSLTTGRKLSHKIIKLIEESLLRFLAGVVTEALSLGLLAGAIANPKTSCPTPNDGTLYSRRGYSSVP
jgi:hypothetical protein